MGAGGGLDGRREGRGEVWGYGRTYIPVSCAVVQSPVHWTVTVTQCETVRALSNEELVSFRVPDPPTRDVVTFE